jgi:hypothetical protein
MAIDVGFMLVPSHPWDVFLSMIYLIKKINRNYVFKLMSLLSLCPNDAQNTNGGGTNVKWKCSFNSER